MNYYIFKQNLEGNISNAGSIVLENKTFSHPHLLQMANDF